MSHLDSGSYSYSCYFFVPSKKKKKGGKLPGSWNTTKEGELGGGSKPGQSCICRMDDLASGMGLGKLMFGARMPSGVETDFEEAVL